MTDPNSPSWVGPMWASLLSSMPLFARKRLHSPLRDQVFHSFFTPFHFTLNKLILACVACFFRRVIWGVCCCTYREDTAYQSLLGEQKLVPCGFAWLWVSHNLIQRVLIYVYMVLLDSDEGKIYMSKKKKKIIKYLCIYTQNRWH